MTDMPSWDTDRPSPAQNFSDQMSWHPLPRRYLGRQQRREETNLKTRSPSSLNQADSVAAAPRLVLWQVILKLPPSPETSCLPNRIPPLFQHVPLCMVFITTFNLYLAIRVQMSKQSGLDLGFFSHFGFQPLQEILRSGVITALAWQPRL